MQSYTICDTCAATHAYLHYHHLLLPCAKLCGKVTALFVTEYSCCSLQCLVDSRPLDLECQVLLGLLPLDSSQTQLLLLLLVRQHLPLDKVPLLLHQHSVDRCLERQLQMALQQAPVVHRLPGERLSAAAKNDHNYCISLT